jgi:glucose uptake protein GlcU
MPPIVQDVILGVAAVVVIVAGVFARAWMRKAVYEKMNQPGKKKSALQKFFGW